MLKWSAAGKMRPIRMVSAFQHFSISAFSPESSVLPVASNPPHAESETTQRMKHFPTVLLLSAALNALAADDSKPVPATNTTSIAKFTATEPLFVCDFSNLPEGALPASFMVMQGDFTVKDLGTNKVMELPGAPLDSHSVLFGPVTNSNITVSARVFGTAKGRRLPTFGIGTGGVAGYKLQIAPGKKSVELLVAESQVMASAPFNWEPGTWTHCKLRIRKTGDALWRVEATAWKAGEAEPQESLISFDTKEAPVSGQASVLGSPFSGTPIWFDDLQVRGEK